MNEHAAFVDALNSLIQRGLVAVAEVSETDIAVRLAPGVTVQPA